MRFVDADEIRRVVAFPLLIDALEAAHRRRKIEIQDAMLGSDGAQYVVRHAVDAGRFMASKPITSFPGNLRDGSALPTVQAVCVLFDGTDGRPLAVIGDGEPARPCAPCGAAEGRASPADITVFKNAGGAHLDLMTAELIFTRLEQPAR